MIVFMTFIPLNIIRREHPSKNTIMSQLNHEKYDSKNPIAQKLLKGFMLCVSNLVRSIDSPILSVTECGCGQGHINRHLESLLPGAQIKGFDIDAKDLAIAKKNRMNPSSDLYIKSIYEIDKNEKADLVVCCEVLEHLEHPDLALEKMTKLNAQNYLFSVPNEPTWRILNFMRGKYMREWGNTPDHCNHWSTRKFCQFVGQQLDIIQIKKPLPWSMVLAQPKR